MGGYAIQAAPGQARVKLYMSPAKGIKCSTITTLSKQKTKQKWGKNNNKHSRMDSILYTEYKFFEKLVLSERLCLSTLSFAYFNHNYGQVLVNKSWNFDQVP